MYYGVKFGDYHSYDDWGLYLDGPVTVSPAVPKTYYVDIPGGNSSIDLTETMAGAAVFYDRELEFKFFCTKPRTEWPALHHTILNAIHGENLKIILDDDSGYYYEGRITVEDWDPKVEDRMEFPTIKATVGPFKWENELTTYSQSFSGSQVSTSRIEVTSGSNVSKQSWNTDLRYGTAEIPTFDFSLYAGIYITYDYYKSAYHNIQFVSCTDGTKAIYNADMSTGGTFYITTEELEEAGIDPSTIYRILLSGASSATVYVDTYSSVSMTVEGGKKNTVPEIYILSSIESVILNGTAYEVNAGHNKNEDMQLVMGDNTLVFTGDFTSTTIEISYRRGWL